MPEQELVETAVMSGRPSRRWAAYLEPLRFDHWIKNLVVPVGSVLALVTARVGPTFARLDDWALAFVLSGLVSSVNYAINEVLDAPFDARHPRKRARPIPSGRVRVGPLLALTAAIALATLTVAAWWFPPPFVAACLALFVAGLLYNLPPARLKDRPFLDAAVESLTNPIRLAIGWYAVPVGDEPLPLGALVAIWAFGAFLMTGKRLAELRLLGPLAPQYRPTFAAYSVRSLLAVQLGYGLLALAALAAFFVTEHPRLVATLPVIVLLLGWALRMTFEAESPVLDPEHLYRRPYFLLLCLLLFAMMVGLAVS